MQKPLIMVVEHRLVVTVIQTKMFDCWYACIQMIQGNSAHQRIIPTGKKTQDHRGASIKGQKLNFSTPVGQDIMTENGLLDISKQVKLADMTTLANKLRIHGPLIVGGSFAMFNTQGHFIVISGCDTDMGTVSVYNPGWGQGRATKTWDYITKHIWKNEYDSISPEYGSIIAANVPSTFDETKKAEVVTRARS